VTIGQYSPVASLFSRMDVRIRMLIILFLIISLLAARWPISLCLSLIFVLLLIMLAKMPIRYALRGLIPPLPFILILALLQIIFNNYGDVGLLIYKTGWITISLADIWSAVALVLRFCALVLLFGLASFSLSTTELIKGLGALMRPLEWLHLPVRDFILIIQVTLRFIPLLALSAERIAKARRVLPILVPLFVQALHKAETMALAMDSRGYRSTAKIPKLPYKKAQPGEVLAVVISIGAVIIAFIF
jgi:energy-coupling factor transport system permease protein